jgi:hypothetical protein
MVGETANLADRGGSVKERAQDPREGVAKSH